MIQQLQAIDATKAAQRLKELESDTNKGVSLGYQEAGSSVTHWVDGPRAR